MQYLYFEVRHSLLQFLVCVGSRDLNFNEFWQIIPLYNGSMVECISPPSQILGEQDIIITMQFPSYTIKYYCRLTMYSKPSGSHSFLIRYTSHLTFCPCVQWGGQTPKEVNYTPVICTALDNIECAGPREFLRGNVPCIK